jgi:hypothetical protein
VRKTQALWGWGDVRGFAKHPTRRREGATRRARTKAGCLNVRVFSVWKMSEPVGGRLLVLAAPPPPVLRRPVERGNLPTAASFSSALSTRRL